MQDSNEPPETQDDFDSALAQLFEFSPTTKLDAEISRLSSEYDRRQPA